MLSGKGCILMNEASSVSHEVNTGLHKALAAVSAIARCAEPKIEKIISWGASLYLTSSQL